MDVYDFSQSHKRYVWYQLVRDISETLVSVENGH